jgi:hypothetical protein
MTFIQIGEYHGHHSNILEVFGEGSAVKTATVSKEAWDAIVQTVLLASNPGLAGSS